MNAGPELEYSQHVQAFRAKVLDYYDNHGRSMPWRDDTSPYSIFLSEMMLQQTQVSRVVEYYHRFRAQYPDFCALADAPLAGLLENWKGLGYNRRAKFLRESARIICQDYAGALPADLDSLVALPGIGVNTAGAIMAYAFNQPVVFIETNIRRVFLHEFFPGRDDITDRQLQEVVARALDGENPRRWYWALMDWGVHLKSQGIHSIRRSRHHSVQSKFEGSKRQLRAAILFYFQEDAVASGAHPSGQDSLAVHGQSDRRSLQMVAEAASARLPDHPGTAEDVKIILSELVAEGFLSGGENEGYRIGD